MILDYLPRFNGSEGRTSAASKLPWPNHWKGVIVLSSLVPFGSLPVVEDIFDRLLPTSLREGMAEFVFAVFKSMLPFRYSLSRHAASYPQFLNLLTGSRLITEIENL